MSEAPIIDLPGFNHIKRARHGYMLYNHNDIFVGRAIEQYGEYGEHEFNMMKRFIKPGDIVMDIGANIGGLTLPMSKRVGKDGYVFAFDPQMIVFQTLCANMALNSIDNVECLPYAVGDENGYIKLPRLNYNRVANYGGLSCDDFIHGNKVRQIKLDDYFYDLDRLSFMKIDVEGMESRVIRGGEKIIQKFRPIMYVENDKEEKSKFLIGLLKDMGYRLYWHLPYLFNSYNFFGNQNNIYPNIASCNMLCVPEESDISIKPEPNTYLMNDVEIKDIHYNPVQDHNGG